MDCLYDLKNGECSALNEKHCNKCSFYKKNTKDNINKFIIQVEKDIVLYPKIFKK